MVKQAKCEALNSGGKRCHFSGSKRVGSLWLCGNHAAKAERAQQTGKADFNATTTNNPVIREDEASMVASTIDKLYRQNLASVEVIEGIIRNLLRK